MRLIMAFAGLLVRLTFLRMVVCLVLFGVCRGMVYLRMMFLVVCGLFVRLCRLGVIGCWCLVILGMLIGVR